MKVTAQKIAALSGSEQDRRLNEIAGSSRRTDAWRYHVIAHGRQQEINAAWDEIFTDWRRLVGVPDPLPLVRLADDD